MSSTSPLEAADLLAALACLAGMLPQLLDQLASWAQREQHAGRLLRIDALAPQPDAANTVHALTDSLRQANHCAQRAAHALDIAHEHTAHLAAVDEPTTRRGQNSCRSVGPSHLGVALLE